ARCVARPPLRGGGPSARRDQRAQAGAPRGRVASANMRSIAPPAGNLGANMRDEIVIRGAREHNLKNVDLVLPRDQLIVFTGLSGSGKSSLAFDTIYAE